MTLSRRNSIKVIGAGVIVVAAGAAVAMPRLDAMPAAAIEGWRGPAADETDPRRRALTWALLAPNPHNLQSWAVDLSQPGEIVLHVDRTRLLPQTDPFSRQILVGHGCFLEILAMAAAAEGYRAEATAFPDRRMVPGQAGRAHRLRQAPRDRHRSVVRRGAAAPYREGRVRATDPRGGAPRCTAGRRRVVSGLSLAIADDPQQVERLRALAIAGSELEMNTPRTHKESIDVVRIGAAEIAAHRDGISLTGPMIWALRQAAR